MYTPPGRARGAPPRGPPAGSPRSRARLPAAARSSWAAAGVGTSSAASCSTMRLDPLGVGLLVDPVEGRDALALEQLGDLLVGEDHQLLDQLVRLGLRTPSARRPRRRRSKLNSGSELSTSSDAPGAAPASAAARLARQGQRLGDRLRAALALPGEDLVELVVVQPRVRADPAAVEAGRAQLAGARRARSRR